MINAKIHQSFGENAGYLIEFSDAHGNYQDRPEHFVTVRDKTDLLKRLYFKNRVHICDTLSHWINQRIHCYPSDHQKLKQLQLDIKSARTYAYESLCSLISRRTIEIEKYRPREDRTTRQYYDKMIQPILTECNNVHTGKAKVHYC